MKAEAEGFLLPDEILDQIDPEDSKYVYSKVNTLPFQIFKISYITDLGFKNKFNYEKLIEIPLLLLFLICYQLLRVFFKLFRTIDNNISIFIHSYVDLKNFITISVSYI